MDTKGWGGWGGGQNKNRQTAPSQLGKEALPKLSRNEIIHKGGPTYNPTVR